MKKKVIIDIVFGLLLVAILFGIFYGFKVMTDTWQEQKKIHEANNTVTAYFIKNSQKETLNICENYMDSIENINYLTYHKDDVLNCVVCIDERYENVTATIYVSDEGNWKDAELESMGKDQYLMDIIKNEKDEDKVITCCIKANNEEDSIERYFSYKASEQEEGIIVPF